MPPVAKRYLLVEQIDSVVWYAFLCFMIVWAIPTIIRYTKVSATTGKEDRRVVEWRVFGRWMILFILFDWFAYIVSLLAVVYLFWRIFYAPVWIYFAK